ncbi:hypothetical protein KIV56_09705 [Cryobacterium breve]|uniref:Cation-transporting P-type ATPase N-terminal domain-containing protein n=1 Tax=Cryobacterium breve TaxID=1259258 RepID=A0ABY7N8P7_9MICO|nr:hypothetical protein KIV56_09705 [Cryobacterium breve]
MLRAFDSSRSGLTTGAADERRLAAGSNAIVALKKESTLTRYLRQFADWMIVLLLASAAITGFLGDLGTAGVLVALVGFNTLIGFVQENRAEKTMEALERLVDPTSQVYRDGVLTEIESRALVPGDVVRLTEGISVPADVRLVDTTAFSTNDFALTGESDPTRKYARPIPHDVPLADRRNLAFAGTSVATGEALGLVTATGMHTEPGANRASQPVGPADPQPAAGGDGQDREVRHVRRRRGVSRRAGRCRAVRAAAPRGDALRRRIRLRPDPAGVARRGQYRARRRRGDPRPAERPRQEAQARSRRSGRRT